MCTLELESKKVKARKRDESGEVGVAKASCGQHLSVSGHFLEHAVLS